MRFKEIKYLSKKAKLDKTTSIIYCILLFSFNLFITIPYYFGSMDILGICLLYILSLLFSNMVSKFIFISFNIHKKATSNFELDSERIYLYKYSCISKKRQKENKRIFRKRKSKYLHKH